VRTGIFIQARLGSSRLERKALLPLAGTTVVGMVMKAVGNVPCDLRALLTDGASADLLGPEARAAGWELFAGSAHDVLFRFSAAARVFDIQRVVRVTGDNPLTCPELVGTILAEHEAHGADLSHYLGCPLGTGVEVIQAAALEAAEREAVAAEEREHITTWHYRHRDRLVILEPQAPADCQLPGVHVSVDTGEDLDRVSAIFAALYRGAPITAARLVAHLAGAPHA
jgi:spore coat polysaccharide biosynthesis protein SpsF